MKVRSLRLQKSKAKNICCNRVIIIFAHKRKAAGFICKQCPKHGMTATASNRSQTSSHVCAYTFLLRVTKKDQSINQMF